MKKNKIIVVSGLLISSFCVDASQKSPATLPVKITMSSQSADFENILVENDLIEQSSFAPNSFDTQILILKKLPTRVEFSNDQGISTSLTEEQIKEKYHHALEDGLLIKQDTGFKEVVLYVDLDEEGQIDRMIAEFVHKSRLTSSFAKEFE